MEISNRFDSQIEMKNKNKNWLKFRFELGY